MLDPKENNLPDWDSREEEIDEDFDDPVWDDVMFDTEEEIQVWEPNDDYNE